MMNFDVFLIDEYWFFALCEGANHLK